MFLQLSLLGNQIEIFYGGTFSRCGKHQRNTCTFKTPATNINTCVHAETIPVICGRT